MTLYDQNDKIYSSISFPATFISSKKLMEVETTSLADEGEYDMTL